MTVQKDDPTADGSCVGLAALLAAVRSRPPLTRAEIGAALGLGRNPASSVVRWAAELGLVELDGTAPSSGGRAPERWRFAGGAGVVLAAHLGVNSMAVGLLDLSLTLLQHRRLDWDVAVGPERTAEKLREVLEDLLSEPGMRPDRLWGIGIGLPAPVDHATGRPVSPPIMPGWDGADLRALLTEHHPVGVWVDNDVNTMALGELACRPGVSDLVYVKVGTGIGAGLVSGRRLHRGGQGCAGDIGHVTLDADRTPCRCGRSGCLEARAGGWALVREATRPAVRTASPYLSQVFARTGRLAPADIGEGALRGDPVCVELIAGSAETVGGVLAVLVNFFNPEEIVIGGGVTASGPTFHTVVEKVIRERALDQAVAGLSVRMGRADQLEGLIGCAAMVVDDLCRADFLAAWTPHGSPVGAPRIVTRARQDRPDPR